MASTHAIAEAPKGIKTTRKLVKVIQVPTKEINQPTGQDVTLDAPTRYFDFSVHSERNELTRLVSWALRNDVTLILHPTYVE